MKFRSLTTLFLFFFFFLEMGVKASKAETQNLATGLSDTFYTYNNISPACKGESYYKLVEMDAKGNQRREIIRYSEKHAYYVPSKQKYVEWFFSGRSKNFFKELMFVVPNQIDDAESLPEIPGVTPTSRPKKNGPNIDYNHLPPGEFGGLVSASQETTPAGNYYFVAPLNQENGIMPVCISGCFNSRAPMSALVVECFEDTMYMFIMNPSTREGAKGRTVFQLFQSVTRVTVIMIVVAYIALMGLKTFLGEGFAKDGYKTFLFAIIKVGLVAYLAIGDGWKDSMYLAYRGIISGASVILMNATSGNNYDGCTFKSSDYPPGKEINSVFDSIDCKLMNYIGFFRDQSSPVLANMFITFLIFPPVLGVLINSLIIFYTTTLLNIIALFVQMYIGSSVYIMILIFISPLTIPTMLFTTSVVKSIFDGWLKMLIGTALSQILCVMLISIFIPLLDSGLYGGNQAEMFVEAPDSAYDSFRIGANASRDNVASQILNNKMATLPAKLTAVQDVKDVSQDCAKFGSSQLYRPMVCLLRQMNSFGQIPILPFFITVFTLYIPKIDNIVPIIGSFVNAIFLLFIVLQLAGSMEGVIKSFTGNAGGAVSSGKIDSASAVKGAAQLTAENNKRFSDNLKRSRGGGSANEMKKEGADVSPPKPASEDQNRPNPPA